MEVPLQWKLSVDGNNQVKSVMNDLNNAFDRGQISGSDYADSLSKMAREGNKANNIFRYQNQIYLSMHPSLNKLVRGMSAVASVGRTMQSIFNSLNILMLVNQGYSKEIATARADEAEAWRELNRAIASGDPEKIQMAQEKLNIALENTKSILNDDFMNKINNIFGFFTNAVVSGGGIAYIIKNFGKDIGKFFTADKLAPLTGFLGTISNIFANPAVGTNLAFFASQFLELIPGMKELKQGFSDWLHTWAEVDGSFIDTAMMKFFQDLPIMAKNAWDFITISTVRTWNDIIGFIETGINFVIKGFSDFVNKIIAGFNSIIKGINKIPGFSIPLIPNFQIEGIQLPRLNTGDIGNPAGSPNGNVQGPTNTYITIEGSVLSEREFTSLMDSTFKKWMKDRGFTGFQ